MLNSLYENILTCLGIASVSESSGRGPGCAVSGRRQLQLYARQILRFRGCHDRPPAGLGTENDDQSLDPGPEGQSFLYRGAPQGPWQRHP